MKKIMILMAAMLMGLANEVGHAGVKAGWISTDVRLDMAVAVDDKSMGKEQTLTAWRGERVAAQWVATTSEAIEKLEVKLNGMAGIPEKNIRRIPDM